MLRRHAVQIAHDAVVRKNPKLIRRKRNGQKESGLVRIAHGVARPRGARGAMMSVGNVKRVDGRERLDEAPAHDPHRPARSRGARHRAP